VKLSPLDIQHQEFGGALSGYSKKQVRKFLAEAADALEDLVRENQRLRHELAKRDERIEALQAGDLDLKHAVVAAERIGNELKQNAQREAELIVRDAENLREKVIREADLKVKQARAEISHLEREHRLFREQFRAMLVAYERSLDTLPGPKSADAAVVVED
jgi:cell division initiation protein